MKKFLALLTVVAVTSLSLSAFAACGSNTGRGSNTTGRPGTGSTGSSSTSVGTPR